MEKINYVTGSAVHPEGEGQKIIVHGCNAIGAWGKGFVLAISERWKKPERDYKEWIQEFSPELGNYLMCKVEEDTYVCNMITQEKIHSENGVPPFRSEALRSGLANLRNFFREKASGESYSVHMPRIGAGLAGGKWSEIEKIIEEELINHGISVTVYTPSWDKKKY